MPYGLPVQYKEAVFNLLSQLVCLLRDISLEPATVSLPPVLSCYEELSALTLIPKSYLIATANAGSDARDRFHVCCTYNCALLFYWICYDFNTRNEDLKQFALSYAGSVLKKEAVARTKAFFSNLGSKFSSKQQEKSADDTVNNRIDMTQDFSAMDAQSKTQEHVDALVWHLKFLGPEWVPEIDGCGISSLAAAQLLLNFLNNVSSPHLWGDTTSNNLFFQIPKDKIENILGSLRKRLELRINTYIEEYSPAHQKFLKICSDKYNANLECFIIKIDDKSSSDPDKLALYERIKIEIETTLVNLSQSIKQMQSLQVILNSNTTATDLFTMDREPQDTRRGKKNDIDDDNDDDWGLTADKSSLPITLGSFLAEIINLSLSTRINILDIKDKINQVFHKSKSPTLQGKDDEEEIFFDALTLQGKDGEEEMFFDALENIPPDESAPQSEGLPASSSALDDLAVSGEPAPQSRELPASSSGLDDLAVSGELASQSGVRPLPLAEKMRLKENEDYVNKALVDKEICVSVANFDYFSVQHAHSVAVDFTGTTFVNCSLYPDIQVLHPYFGFNFSNANLSGAKFAASSSLVGVIVNEHTILPTAVCQQILIDNIAKLEQKNDYLPNLAKAVVAMPLNQSNNKEKAITAQFILDALRRIDLDNGGAAANKEDLGLLFEKKKRAVCVVNHFISCLTPEEVIELGAQLTKTKHQGEQNPWGYIRHERDLLRCTHGNTKTWGDIIDQIKGKLINADLSQLSDAQYTNYYAIMNTHARHDYGFGLFRKPAETRGLPTQRQRQWERRHNNTS